MDWFTSDTHFSQVRTLELSKRPFNGVQEMDKIIIKNWNSKVSQHDTVYHAGDFGDYNKVKELNGNIILICGNYEEKDLKTKFNNDFNLFNKYLKELGFKQVFLKEIFYSNNSMKNIKICHEPLNCDMNKFNLFGHVHGLCKIKTFGLNIGIDSHHFYPININDVLFYKNAIENYYDDNVFC